MKTKSLVFLEDQRVYVCRPKPVREYVMCEVGGGGGGSGACVRASTTRFTVVSFAVMVDWALKNTRLSIDLSNTRYRLFLIYIIIYLYTEIKRKNWKSINFFTRTVL